MITKANRNLLFHASLVRPSADGLLSKEIDYFPLSCPITFGVLEVDLSPPNAPPQFPYNIRFEAMDFVNDGLSLDDKYDVVLWFVLFFQSATRLTLVSMSLTKWVHLNWGDEGLKKLFIRAYDCLAPNGILIVEPQPWSSYGKKSRVSEVDKSSWSDFIL